jgi:glycosyltransferase involved in cell wall biosynthesis
LTFREPRAVIGTDIQGLCGISVFAQSGIHLVYDAQEITTYGFPGLSSIEKSFWEDIERSLLKENLTAVTVSPGISEWHEAKFDFRFEVVPNFEPLRNGEKVSGQTEKPIKFVYYGGCAPEKNLAQLLKAWSVSKLKATLTIVSQRNADRIQLEQFWKTLSYRNSAVEFMSHGDATDVCEFLSQFDVGVLPYDYDYPYSEASPNKFGQYLAAGLAIVANQQGFVSKLIVENQLGLVLDFSDHRVAADDLALIAEIEIVDEFKRNSRATFQDQLHWEKNLNFLKNSLAESCSIMRDLTHDARRIGMMRVPIPVRFTGILKYVSKESVNGLLKTKFGVALARSLSRFTTFNAVKRFLISTSESRPQ